jgi:hypothetical protein
MTWKSPSLWDFAMAVLVDQYYRIPPPRKQHIPKSYVCVGKVVCILTRIVLLGISIYAIFACFLEFFLQLN